MVKLLVSTKETQGKRSNDFCWVPEGEVVHFSFECDSDKTIDGYCGCRRSMVGLDCTKATTTMKVAEIELSEEEIIGKLVSHYIKSWKMEPERAVKISFEELKDLKDVVKNFPLGSIIEKRGTKFKKRS